MPAIDQLPQNQIEGINLFERGNFEQITMNLNDNLKTRKYQNV